MKNQISTKNHQTMTTLFMEKGGYKIHMEKKNVCLCQRKEVKTQPSLTNAKSKQKNLYQHVGKRQYTRKE